MLIKNFEEVIEKLKTKFVDYLEENGINTKKPFLCLDPNHNESHPSMGVVPQSNFTRAHCLSCNAIADIFDAVHVLEGKPKNGPGFIEETVIYLAQKYQIEIDLKELTEEEKYKIDCFNAYKEAAKYISIHPNEKVKAEITARGWNLDLSRERMIGGIDSYANYKQALLDAGFSITFLENIDLLNEHMFNPNGLIFTISDNYGRPCGFSVRNLNYDPNDQESRKYINTSAKCPIYEKSKRLYNIHNTGNNKGTIYITEGCADTEALVQRGLLNVVGIGGTSFTDYHALELLKSKRTNLTLLTDGDDAGIKAASRIIEKLSEYRDFSIHLLVLPDGLDPDDFVKEYGIESLNKLKRWTAFEWKINSFDDRIDTILIRQEIVPIIASNSSPIEREKMIKVLSNKVGVSEQAIKEEVQQVIDQTELTRANERDLIIKEMTADLRNSPGSWRQIFSETQQNLDALSLKYNEDSFAPAIFLSELEEMKKEQESPEEDSVVCNFWQFKEFQEAIDGNHEATLNVIGGQANCGKTALMSQLALQLANIPQEYGNKYTVFFHTIDDTVKQFTNRLICQVAVEKYKDISLNMVNKPNKFQNQRIINEARNYAYDIVMGLVRDGRLFICGGENRGSPTLSYAEEMCKFGAKQAEKDGSQLVYFLDNFHRLRDYAGLDERTRFKKLSNGIKDTAKRYGIPSWATMEYNKTVGTGRPTNNSISESIAMEYDANFIMHLYNDMHVKNQLGEDPEIFFQRIDAAGRYYKAPRIEAIVGKNKLSSFKGSLWFDFYADQSRMVPVSAAEVQSDLERVRTEQRAA